MPVSKGCSQTLISSFQFRWIPVGMKYLGIRLCSDLTNIIPINIEPLLHQLKLNKLKFLNLTLGDKINIFKMLVAPLFNYISMMIPIIISDVFFKQYRRLIKAFLGNGKNPRIGPKNCCGLKASGGLALPDLELYNIAFEISKKSRHWDTPNLDLGLVRIERAVSAPFNVFQFLSQKPIGTIQQDSILLYSKWAWTKAHKILGICPHKQGYSSVWNNLVIRVGKSPFVRRKWLEKGTQKIENLYTDGSFLPFSSSKRGFQHVR